ncbi:MAG: T9SS type A sorting domain-containing protein [Bacteroidia bacterium]|nr:T9SS type A sorting domain-containing protein [Bacteroidia bacterium]
MKTGKFLTGVAFLIALAVILLLAEQGLKPSKTAVRVTREEEKDAPNDEFFMVRSYPDKTFNAGAYMDAIGQAKQDIEMKSISTASSAQWTVEGPENICGRINCIAVDPLHHDTIYVGTASGGIFKTTDGGLDWFPVFDNQPYLAISDIIFDPFDDETLYVGTGDANISGYPFIGDGVYKTTDGGQTWTHLGLTQQSIIPRIVLDRKNPAEMYAAAMGIPFQPSANRGLYKTTDGGQNWNQVLSIYTNGGIITSGSTDAGITDLLIDPSDHNVLYAAGWNRIRTNSVSVVTGNAARIYKSTNGGTSWTMLGGGLPIGIYSRIGLWMSALNHNVIFAEYVNTSLDLDSVYKTSDGGLTWTTIPISTLPYGILGEFGWYFGQIRTNPWNDNEIWLLGVDLYKTTDGGNTWNMAGPGWYNYEFHADKHDLVFLDSLTLLCATDGGLYKSTDGGNSWSALGNIPNGQLYHVTCDWYVPGLYCAGAQDNGTICGNSSTAWTMLFGGDGFQTYFDYFNSGVMYAESQNGALYYQLNNIWQYFGTGINSNDRRSWDMPLAMSRVTSGVFYTGTYRVYKNNTAPAGQWANLSNDLTSGVMSTFHVITTLDESSLNNSVLYAGTSDGYVWRSLNSGATWTNISSGLPTRYVTSVKASPNTVNTVFVAHSGYRDDDFIPHIHKSLNNGTTWTDISGDLPQLAINNILLIGGYSDNLVIVGTDGGVYLTENGGTNWQRVGSNMPIVAVYDVEYEPATGKIIAGTYGRSVMSVSLNDIVTITNNPLVEKQAQMKVYPSLATDHVNVEMDSPKPQILSLINSDGKMIMQTNISQGKAVLDVHDIKPGVYFIKSSETNATARIVVMHK